MGVADHMPAFSQPERYSRSTIVQSEGHTTFGTRYKLPDIEFHLIPRRMRRHTSGCFRLFLDHWLLIYTLGAGHVVTSDFIKAPVSRVRNKGLPRVAGLLCSRTRYYVDKPYTSIDERMDPRFIDKVEPKLLCRGTCPRQVGCFIGHRQKTRAQWSTLSDRRIS